MEFKNKVCVITGGANGIGFCLVNEFIKKGAKVAFIDIDKIAGEKLFLNIKKDGGDGLFFCGDIAEENTLKEFSREVIRTYGKVDYLINNACLSRKGILSDCSFDDFNYVLRVGVTAPYMLSKLFLEYFNQGGAIVNISSTRATMSQEDTESYSATKGGISALTHALAMSLSGKVRVNSVSPGWIDVSANYNNDYESKHSIGDKEQHPVKRVGKPIDIAKAVMFLCSEDNDFITGENITVDGGMTKLMIYNDDYNWKCEV
ncbi:SDR family oxidoreductase [Clostridium sp. YIM B02551]|uniref:SDR family oxidoreductase n=1 Tax=Clostridium sp. YIM B02551 TaxID=2910679 RepID=UPI001EEC84D1|nr:SDR family oxidoreductase [Clostridium sp. YIM B02551]